MMQQEEPCTQACVDFGHCYCGRVVRNGRRHLQCCMCGHCQLAEHVEHGERDERDEPVCNAVAGEDMSAYLRIAGEQEKGR
jgi:hypothetical protein